MSTYVLLFFVMVASSLMSAAILWFFAVARLIDRLIIERRVMWRGHLYLIVPMPDPTVPPGVLDPEAAARRNA